MINSNFPEGWEEKRVKNVIAFYENQTEEEAVAEDEAAYQDKNQTFMKIPAKLVPIVRELISNFNNQN